MKIIISHFPIFLGIFPINPKMIRMIAMTIEYNAHGQEPACQGTSTGFSL